VTFQLLRNFFDNNGIFSKIRKFSRCSIVIHQYEIIANCTSAKSNNRSKDFITVSYTGQRSVSDDIEVCKTIIANATSNHNSLQELADALVDEWSRIPQVEFQTLIRSFQNR
jgi:hypothetical protein